MKALTVVPLKAESVDPTDVPPPPESDGPVLVETLAVGICGTDIEIIAGAYGWAPPGERAPRPRPRVARPGAGGAAGPPVAEGDLVVGIVRRPDPVPCANCAVGEWDFCRNGQYTERGIKEHDGYARALPDHARLRGQGRPALGTLGVLLEPTSVVAKAWEQIDRIGARALGARRRP